MSPYSCTLPGILDIWAALLNSYPNAYVSGKEAICPIFMTVIGMTRQGCKPATYSMRGWHAIGGNH